MITTRPPEDEDIHPNERPEVKAERRSMVAELTAQFLASGGIIKQVKRGDESERKPGFKKMIYGNAPDKFRG